jgi:serine-type D-Ala-D-Ala carboxypeptidase (penicillin-binding protein 5/6)
MRLARRALLALGGPLVVCGLACLALGVPAASAADQSAPPRPPQLEAPEALLIETDLGTTLFARHAERRVAIASTTKLMTAYVTLENDPLTQLLVEQPYDGRPGESLAGVPAGARYSVADMLRAMLLPSGNDVAHSLAIDVGGTTAHFVELMNAAATRLGLTDTHYTTPIGLDRPGNYSTAENLATLAEDLLRDPFFAAVVREQNAYLPDGVEVNNTNTLLGNYPFVVGVKTGHTLDAGYCLVGAASWHGVHLLSVVLGDPSEAARDDDTLALLRYGLALYRDVHFAVAGRTYQEVAENGSAQRVALVATRSAALVVPRADTIAVSFAGVPTELQGPLAAGTPEGSLNVSENGAQVLSVPLVTASAVASAAAARSASVGLLGGAGSVLAILAGCSLMVMRRVRRRRVST